MSALGSTNVSSGNSASGGWSDFFGQVASGLGQGLASIGKDVLPLWTAGQLGLQQNDQLSQTTYQPYVLPGSYQYTSSDELFSLGDFKVTTTHVVLGGLAIVGLVLLLR